MYQVYVLILNEDFSTPHYFGITKTSLIRRFQQHLYCAFTKSGTKKKCYSSHWIKKRYLEGHYIQMVCLHDNLTRQEALSLEEKYIRTYADKYNLKNLRLRDEIHEYPLSGTKKVHQYDINGNFIKEWRSISDAHQALGSKRNATTIIKCCKGKSLTYKGFIWRYAEDAFDKFRTTRVKKVDRKRRRIICYNYKTKETQIFEHTQEAADLLHLERTQIFKNCKYPFIGYVTKKVVFKLYGEFIFLYEDDAKTIEVLNSQLETDTLLDYYSCLQEEKDRKIRNKGKKTGLGDLMKVNINHEIILLNKHTLHYTVFPNDKELKISFVKKFGNSAQGGVVPILKRGGSLYGWYVISDSLTKSQLHFCINTKENRMDKLRTMIPFSLYQKILYAMKKNHTAKLSQLLSDNNLILLNKNTEDIVRTIGKPITIEQFIDQN